jgi:Protein of unknown function, DUF547
MNKVCLLAAVLAAWSLAAARTPLAAQEGLDRLHGPFDRMLDLYVRDGLVYYRALKSERGALDRYVAALGGTSADDVGRRPKAEQMAFWINAYNALVLRSVVDHYPIRGRAPEYPPSSVRQVPGAFDRTPRRVAGRSLTLDAIERDVLTGFGDPRVFLALGRGSVGGGRLRSEAFTGAAIESQLQRVAAEFPTRGELLRIDQLREQISVTPILSWRAESFISAYADQVKGPAANRSPIERALVTFISPHLLPAERAFVERNQFKVVFHDYDWRLNDLTGGGPR